MLNMLGRLYEPFFFHGQDPAGNKKRNDPWLIVLPNFYLQSRVISVHSCYLTSLVTSLSANWTFPLFFHFKCLNFYWSSSWNFLPGLSLSLVSDVGNLFWSVDSSPDLNDFFLLIPFSLWNLFWYLLLSFSCFRYICSDFYLKLVFSERFRFSTLPCFHFFFR